MRSWLSTFELHCSAVGPRCLDVWCSSRLNTFRMMNKVRRALHRLSNGSNGPNKHKNEHGSGWENSNAVSNPISDSGPRRLSKAKRHTWSNTEDGSVHASNPKENVNDYDLGVPIEAPGHSENAAIHPAVYPSNVRPNSRSSRTSTSSFPAFNNSKGPRKSSSISSIRSLVSSIRSKTRDHLSPDPVEVPKRTTSKAKAGTMRGSMRHSGAVSKYGTRNQTNSTTGRDSRPLRPYQHVDVPSSSDSIEAKLTSSPPTGKENFEPQFINVEPTSVSHCLQVHHRDPVVEEHVLPEQHTIYQTKRTRSYHLHEHHTIIQPILDPEPNILPEEHYIEDANTGEVRWIPREIGQQLMTGGSTVTVNGVPIPHIGKSVLSTV